MIAIGTVFRPGAFERLQQQRTGATAGGRAPGGAVMRGASTKRASPTPSTPPIAPPTPGSAGGMRTATTGAGPVGTFPIPTGGPQIASAGGFNVAGPQREAINPADRGTRLTLEGFQLPQLNVPGVTAEQLGGLGAAPGPVTAGTQGTPQGLDFSGFGIDPSQFGGGGQFSVSGGGGGGFNVDAQSVLDQAMQTFQSQLPGLNLDLADQTEGLAKRTSALGRTGSGLFNRDTDQLTERSRANRESLLGNLALQGATTDAANDLQAQIATGGFSQNAADRVLRGQMSNAGNALNAALTGAQLNQQGQQFDISNLIGQEQFNIGNMLNADLANQATGLAARGQDLGARGQDLSRLQGNQNMDFQTGQFNINNALQAALEQTGLAERQQAREDRLASEASNNMFRQLGLLGQGFQGAPTNALNQFGQTLMGAGGQFGANAGQLNQQIGQTGGFIGDMLGQFLSQPRIPNAPAPIPTPNAPDFSGLPDFNNMF